VPLRVVATDIRNAAKVVFSQGNVAKAVRASISIPGVFSPVIIDTKELVDGALVDPIPISVLRDMGANIIIAVDISKDLEEVHIHGSRVRERSTFYEYFKNRFIKSQVGFFKEFVMETKRFRLPHFVKKYLVKLIDRFMNPKRMYRYMTGRTVPDIVKIGVQSILIISSKLYRENLKHGRVDVIIRPDLGGDLYSRFEHAARYIEAGEKAAQNSIGKIEKALKRGRLKCKNSA
jgi:predicted acylesterase/phospholipase RssA